MFCRLHLVTILLSFTAALVIWDSTVVKIPRCHERVAGFVNISAGLDYQFFMPFASNWIANYASRMYIYYDPLHR